MRRDYAAHRKDDRHEDEDHYREIRIKIQCKAQHSLLLQAGRRNRPVTKRPRAYVSVPLASSGTPRQNATMPCLVGLLALFTPRLAIILVVIFSDYIGRAYETTLWPLLGFFFMPMTTLAYAWAVNGHGSVTGLGLVVVVLAVLLDLGLIGSAGTSKRHGKLRRHR